MTCSTPGAHAAEAADDHDHAHRLLRRIVADYPDADIERLWLSYYHLSARDTGSAAMHLEQFVTRSPSLVWEIDAQRLLQLVQEADPPPDPLFRALDRLLDLGWDVQQPGTDRIWHTLAIASLERSNLATTGAAIAMIDEPMAIIRLRIDRRFDPWIDRGAPQLDVERVARTQLRRSLASARIAPMSNDAAGDLLTALLIVGGERKVERLTRPGGRYGRAPDRSGTNQGWIANARADALHRLGRHAEALKALKAASGASENGDPNVSQLLNLAHLGCRLGRAEYAPRAIADVGRMSGYGRMILTSIELCAALAQDDETAIERSMRILRRHRQDAPDVYLDSLLRLDRNEQAASALIKMLDTPATRTPTLLWVQAFREEPAKGTAFRVARNRRLVLARQDVTRAIDAVGRRERYRTYRS